MTSPEASTLRTLLAPIRTSALAEATGRAAGTVSRWRSGELLPDVTDLEPIANLLRVDLAIVTRIVAAERTTRTESSGAA